MYDGDDASALTQWTYELAASGAMAVSDDFVGARSIPVDEQAYEEATTAAISEPSRNRANMKRDDDCRDNCGLSVVAACLWTDTVVRDGGAAAGAPARLAMCRVAPHPNLATVLIVMTQEAGKDAWALRSAPYWMCCTKWTLCNALKHACTIIKERLNLPREDPPAEVEAAAVAAAAAAAAPASGVLALRARPRAMAGSPRAHHRPPSMRTIRDVASAMAV